MALSLMHVPGIAGYAFDQSADLGNPRVREKLSGSAIRGFVNIVDKWGLTEAQARKLLGDIASSTFHAWKNAPDKQKLTQDVLLRISFLVGIYKALNVYFDKPLADQWPTLGNRGLLFNGGAPIDYMMSAGQPGMLRVRQMLDAWRGGH